MIDFKAKCALVTGGSRGVGRATALLLARGGADVAIGYRTRTVAANDVVREIEALGRRAVAIAGDVAQPESAAGVVKHAATALGGLDIFVANAGVWPVEDTSLDKLSPERWDATLAANLDSVYYGIRAAVPHLKGGGRIVIVSSTAGQRGEANHADYAASKGALISLTKSLAVELAPDVTVNCVAPGWIDTEMSATAYAGNGMRRIAEAIPLGRVASAEDVAGPIVFLCSALARHVTGEVLNINGGSVLCG